MTVTVILSKPDSVVSITYEFWKLKEVILKIKSMQCWLCWMSKYQIFFTKNVCTIKQVSNMLVA